jgi:hypothetical protein
MRTIKIVFEHPHFPLLPPGNATGAIVLKTDFIPAALVTYGDFRDIFSFCKIYQFFPKSQPALHLRHIFPSQKQKIPAIYSPSGGFYLLSKRLIEDFIKHPAQRKTHHDK